jgi:hypothetical protein
VGSQSAAASVLTAVVLVHWSTFACKLTRQFTIPGVCGCTTGQCAAGSCAREPRAHGSRGVRDLVCCCSTPAQSPLLAECSLAPAAHDICCGINKPSTHAHLRISLTLRAQAEAAHARVQALRQQVAELERQVDQEREARAEVDSELEVGDGIQGIGPQRA